MEKFILLFIILFLIIVIVNVVNGKDNLKNKENYSSNYVKLYDTWTNPPYMFNQLFSSETGRCAGGPYMFSSNPYLTALCQNFQEPGCTYSGFNRGGNVKFNYSSLSNGAWDNALCDSCNPPQSLCVL